MSEITPITKQANRNYSMDILRILAILIVIFFMYLILFGIMLFPLING